MKEFMLIFRINDVANFKPTPEQIQERLSWLTGIAAQNKLVDQGNSLSPFTGSAATVRPDNIVTDGPYTEIKEFIVGYVMVSTGTFDEAVAIAKENPIFELGGSVEVREVIKHKLS